MPRLFYVLLSSSKFRSYSGAKFDAFIRNFTTNHMRTAIYERRIVAEFTYRHLKPDRRCCPCPYRRFILSACRSEELRFCQQQGTWWSAILLLILLAPSIFEPDLQRDTWRCSV